MADKRDYDEEYHFSEDESQDDNSHENVYEADDEHTGRGRWIQNNLKRIVLPVAILSMVIGFASYKYYKSHSLSADSNTVLVPPVDFPVQNTQSVDLASVAPQPAPAVTPDMSAPAPQPAAPQPQENTQLLQSQEEQNKKLAALNDAKEQMGRVIESYKKQVEELQQNVQTLTEQNQNYQSQISNLQNTLTVAQQHFDEYAKSMDKKLNELTVALNHNFYALHAELDKLEPEVQHAAKYVTAIEKAKERKEELNKRVRFNVQALIPKRAWLIGDNGTTITVSVGQEVPGYGTVSSIDASAGTVSTTSGEVFHFG